MNEMNWDLLEEAMPGMKALYEGVLILLKLTNNTNLYYFKMYSYETERHSIIYRFCLQVEYLDDDIPEAIFEVMYNLTRKEMVLQYPHNHVRVIKEIQNINQIQETFSKVLSEMDVD